MARALLEPRASYRVVYSSGMHLQIPHNLPGKDRAVAKIKTELVKNRAALNQHVVINEEKWEGDTLTFAIELQGKAVTGTLQVTERDFVVDAKLPLMWRLFEKRIEAEVAKHVQTL